MQLVDRVYISLKQLQTKEDVKAMDPWQQLSAAHHRWRSPCLGVWETWWDAGGEHLRAVAGGGTKSGKEESTCFRINILQSLKYAKARIFQIKCFAL